MKKSKFSEAQIATALRQVVAGAPITEVTRKLGVSEQTYTLWQRRYGQMSVAEIRRLRQSEEENRKLKQLVADLKLSKATRQEALAKRGRSPHVSPSSSGSCSGPSAQASDTRVA